MLIATTFSFLLSCFFRSSKKKSSLMELKIKITSSSKLNLLKCTKSKAGISKSHQIFHYTRCITPKRVTSWWGPFPRHCTWAKPEYLQYTYIFCISSDISSDISSVNLKLIFAKLTVNKFGFQSRRYHRNQKAVCRNLNEQINTRKRKVFLGW